MNNASRASASKWVSKNPSFSVTVGERLHDRFRVEQHGRHVGIVKRDDRCTERGIWIAFNISSRGQKEVAVHYKTLTAALDHIAACALNDLTDGYKPSMWDACKARPLSPAQAKLFRSTSALVAH